MNLQYLQYIIEIDNYGSISSAAENIFVSQPYLSRILKEVEQHYQITIFTRGKNGIIATQSGRLFIDMAKDLIDNALRFEQTFEDYQDMQRLRITSGTVSHSMDAFLKMLPSMGNNEFRIQYRETSVSETIEDVYTNSTDIGVIVLTDQNQADYCELLKIRNIVYKRLFETKIWLVCGDHHPLLKIAPDYKLEDIYQYGFVLHPDERNGRKHAIESFYGTSLIDFSKIRQLIYVDSRSALHNVLTNTNFLSSGIAPAHKQIASYHIASLPLPKDVPHRFAQTSQYAMYYIYKKGQNLSRTAKAYISFLEKNYGQNSDYQFNCDKEWLDLQL